MGRWLEAAKRYAEPLTKPTEPTKPTPVADETVLSVKSVLSERIETDFEERAAIIEYEAGAPREWAEAFARLLSLQPPAGTTPERWQQIVDDGGRFIDRWSRQACALGWDAHCAFGLYFRDDAFRLDPLALVPFLCGREVFALTDEAAIIEAGDGSRIRYPHQEAEAAAALWDQGSSPC